MMNFKSNLGLSLVELLVSIVVAGIIFTGVLNVVINSRVSFVNEQEASFIQENARYATEMLTRDIRIAGSMGCAGIESATVANAVNGDLGGIFSGDAINGFEGTGGVITDTSDPGVWPSAYRSDAVDGSDSVILRYADPDSALAVASSNYNSAVLNLHQNHSWAVGDKLMIVDTTCRNVGIFEVTEGNNKQMKHNSGSGVPGNCTKVIYANASFDCSASPCNPVNCGGNPAQPYSNGATIMAFVANAYYIGESNVIPGTPALMRQVLTSSGSRAEELAQGIEHMELVFGVDTEVPLDGDVDYFVDANEVDDWGTVVAVRYTLTLRSQTEVFDSNQTVNLNGVEYTDRYLRQLASSTVRIRNRG